MWSASRNGLLWVDILERKLYLGKLDGSQMCWSFDKKVAAVVETGNDQVVLVFCDSVAVFDPLSEKLTDIVQVDEDIPRNRANDSKCDPHGNLWIGTMDDHEELDSGRLWCISSDATKTLLESGIRISNTLAWDEARKLFYFADSGKRRVYRYAYSHANSVPIIRERTIFVDLSGTEFTPDGSCLDCEGYLWNAQWGGARVVRYSPDGQVDRVLDLPVNYPTSCSFGGPDNSTLFITSANPEASRWGGNLDGCVLSVVTDTAGGPVHRFGCKKPA